MHYIILIIFLFINNNIVINTNDESIKHHIKYETNITGEKYKKILKDISNIINRNIYIDRNYEDNTLSVKLDGKYSILEIYNILFKYGKYKLHLEKEYNIKTDLYDYLITDREQLILYR